MKSNIKSNIKPYANLSTKPAMNSVSKSNLNFRVNLDLLKKPFDFWVYPEDGIKKIKITMIRLKSYNDHIDLTIKTPANCQRSIHEIVIEQIHQNSAIINSLAIKEVELNIELAPREGQNKWRGKQARNIIFLVKSSGEYQLKNIDQNARNDLPDLAKYLKHWKLAYDN